MQRIDASKLDLKDSSIVNIRRVTKVVKGGKNSRFSVTATVTSVWAWASPRRSPKRSERLRKTLRRLSSMYPW